MYDDIIDVSYPFDLGHKRMSEYDRCSQFMPFSALVGYKDAVMETARITDNMVFLDDEAKEILDNKIGFILNNLPLSIITIKYFVPDSKKAGGSFATVSGVIKKIDLYKNIIYIENRRILIDNIVDIDGDCFSVADVY